MTTLAPSPTTLAPTALIDSDAPAVQAFAEQHAQGATDRGPRLEHGDAHVRVRRQERAHEVQGRTGVGHVIGDQYPLAGEIRQVRSLTHEDRLGQGFADIRVVLDVHMAKVLDVERIGDAGADEGDQ